MRESFELRVGDLPIRPVPVISRELSVARARKIADLKQTTLLLVACDARLTGILDVRELAAAPDDARAELWMSPLEGCLSAATSLVRARELFVRAGTATLPVAAGAFLIGVVSRVDLERALRDRRRDAPTAIPSIGAVA